MKKAMREMARRFLSRPSQTVQFWCNDPAVMELVTFVYNGGIWDRDFREHIKPILTKRVEVLNEAEIYTYLTFIVCMERTSEGCLDAHLANGTLDKLLKRYLELTEEG